MCNQVLMCNFALMQSYFDLYVNVLSLWKCRSRLEDLWSLPTRSATPLAHLVRTALSPVIVDSGEGGLLHPHGRPGHILEMCPPSALHSRCTVSILFTPWRASCAGGAAVRSSAHVGFLRRRVALWDLKFGRGFRSLGHAHWCHYVRIEPASSHAGSMGSSI